MRSGFAKVTVGVLFVLSVLFAPAWFVGCSSSDPVVGPDGVEGLNRALDPLRFEVPVTPVKDTYALTDHPVLEAVLLAVDSRGEWDRVRTEGFPYPLTWVKDTEATEVACKVYNKRGFTAQVRCNAPSAVDPYKFCVFTVIDGREIRGCQELMFQ